MGEGEKPKRSPVLLVILIIIVLVALWILVPNISNLTEPEDEKTKTEIEPIYREFEGDSVILYKNHSLNVSINLIYNVRRNVTEYKAQWANIWDHFSSASGDSPRVLYDDILRQGHSLNYEQIEWFEYMIENVVK